MSCRVRWDSYTKSTYEDKCFLTMCRWLTSFMIYEVLELQQNSRLDDLNERHLEVFYYTALEWLKLSRYQFL